MTLRLANDAREKNAKLIKSMIHDTVTDLYKFSLETQKKLDSILQLVESSFSPDTNDREVQTEPNEESQLPNSGRKIVVRLDLFEPKIENSQQLDISGDESSIEDEEEEEEEKEGETAEATVIANDMNLSNNEENTRKNAPNNINENEPPIKKNIPELSSNRDSNIDKIDDSVSINPEWLCSVRPMKSPYFPQIGDEVLYFHQCHKDFFDYVRLIDLYEIHERDMPWTKYNLQAHELARIKKISFKRIENIRICQLKLERCTKTGIDTGEFFELDYHHISGRSYDYLILRQHFNKMQIIDWQPRNRFRTIIDNAWHFGTILSVGPVDQQYPCSWYKCLFAKIDNGSECLVSPWHIEQIDKQNLPRQKGCSVPVTQEDLNRLYFSTPNDWYRDDRIRIYEQIHSHFELNDEVAKPFDDLSDCPSYVSQVEYPIDLKTIKARLKNFFYRRIEAFEFDIAHLINNVRQYHIVFKWPANALFTSYEHQITYITNIILNDLSTDVKRNFIEPINVKPVLNISEDAFDASIGSPAKRRRATEESRRSNSNLTLE